MKRFSDFTVSQAMVLMFNSRSHTIQILCNQECNQECNRKCNLCQGCSNQFQGCNNRCQGCNNRYKECSQWCQDSLWTKECFNNKYNVTSRALNLLLSRAKMRHLLTHNNNSSSKLSSWIKSWTKQLKKGCINLLNQKRPRWVMMKSQRRSKYIRKQYTLHVCRLNAIG